MNLKIEEKQLKKKNCLAKNRNWKYIRVNGKWKVIIRFY